MSSSSEKPQPPDFSTAINDNEVKQEVHEGSASSDIPRERNLHVPRPNIPPNGPAVETYDPLRVTGGESRRRGDFERDLLPGGISPGMPPGWNGGGGLGGGNQVGPDHPIFDRTYGNEHEMGGFQGGPASFGGLPGLSNLGMRPRFDPYGPPGGPSEPGRSGRFAPPGRGSRGGNGRGPMPPGGFGYPNPDHLRPPGDYFS